MNTNNINENLETSQSQESKILDWMLRGHRINGIDALNLFGCWRLPARIADLRKKGFNIASRTVTTNNGKRIKEYYV